MAGEDAAVYIAKWIEPQHTKARVLLPALQFFYSVKRNRFRRFADLAIFERSASVPAASRGAEMAFEGARKFGGAGEARLERESVMRFSGDGFQERGRAFQAHAADVAIQRFASNPLENAMEMKWREATDLGQSGQREFAIEMPGDVVLYTIDAILMVVATRHAGYQR